MRAACPTRSAQRHVFVAYFYENSHANVARHRDFIVQEESLLAVNLLFQWVNNTSIKFQTLFPRAGDQMMKTGKNGPEVEEG